MAIPSYIENLTFYLYKEILTIKVDRACWTLMTIILFAAYGVSKVSFIDSLLPRVTMAIKYECSGLKDAKAKLVL